MMYRSLLAVVTIAVCLGPGLLAQEVRMVQAGDRVRVNLASRIAPARLIGTVVEIGPDTLVVEREEGGLRRLSRAQVGRIEVSVRREYEGGKAAGYGVLAAAPLLILLGIAAPIIAAEGNDAWVLAMLGAAVGGSLLVGILIGGTTPQDTWTDARWTESGVAPDSLPPPRIADSTRQGLRP